MIRHALIVDDNRALAENLGEILTAEGYQVHIFDDPLCALQETQHLPFELALLDVRMPHLNGVALHRRLLEHHAHAAFVLMSAFTEDSLIAEALAAGVHCVLAKPVSIPLLLEAIDHRGGSSREILLVDDDAHFSEALTEVLHESGYMVHRARTASAGRELASSALLAAIIDVRLPDEDGVTLGAELARRLEIRVILISGFAVDEARDLAERYGGRVRVFEKPFPPDALLALLSEMRSERA